MLKTLLLVATLAAHLGNYPVQVKTHLEGICKAAGKTVETDSMPADAATQKTVGTAFRNLSMTYVINNWQGADPEQPNPTVGSYTVACVLYELATGESAIGNGYVPLHMEQEPDRVEIAQLCAHAAVLKPGKPTNIHRRMVFGENYDESKVPSYTLPDPLTFDNGKKVRSVRQWEKKRRPELLALFEREMFGRAPGRPEGLHFETLYRDCNALGGKAVRKEVKVHFDNTGKHYLKLLVYTPKGASGPVPAFLGINFKGNYATTFEEGVLLPTEEELKAYGVVENLERGAAVSRWPLEMIIEAGYGIATFYRGDIDPDYDDVFQNGVHPLFYKKGQDYPEPDEWGTIAAWAWGLSRALDYLETDPDVDARKVAVFGHSRLGKTALWAGATDQRFAAVISNDSGNCGAAISRRHFGETIRKVNWYRPQWFCDNFLKYNDNEAALPFDQHTLIALSAPRPVYVASGSEDINADPYGEFLGLKEAGCVYSLYGLKTLDGVEWPAADTPVGEGPMRYHMRTGKHDITAYDWQQYIRFADDFLR